MVKSSSRNGSREDVAERQELLGGYPCRSGSQANVIQIMPISPEKPPREDSPAEEEQDPISEVIGEYGRWQLLMTFLLSLFSFPCTFHIYSPTFTSASSDFWCARPQVLQNLSLDVWKNYSQPHGPCSIMDVDWSSLSLATIQGQSSHGNKSFVDCQTWEYDHSFSGETIIEQWNLVCEKNYLNNLSEMIFLTGVAVGGIVGGFVSDRFGRKTTLFTMLAFQSIFGLVMAFSKSYEMYLILKIFLGLCSVSVVLSGFVLSVELVGGKWITVAGVCNFLPLPVSYIIVSGMSLVLPDWRQLQLALSLPGLFLIPLWWVLPESPRWLLNMGRIKDVIPILTQAAKLNNRPIPQSLDKFLMTSTKDSSETVTSPGCSNLFVPPYRKRTYLISICWFAVTLSYYGLVLNIGNLGGDLHFTSMILGIVEIPAIVLSIPVLLKAGRRYPICISMIICGVFCALSVVVQKALVDSSWASIVCIMVGKFSISAANIMMPTYTAELYPTLIRNLGVGSSQWSAGLALMCIPYLWTMSPIFDGVPLLVIGALSVVGGLVVLFLPETGATSCTRNEKQKRKTSIATICNSGSFKAMADRGAT